MDGFRDFTLDPLKYPLDQMKKFVSEELHPRGKKWVPILDPGIKVEPGYGPYEAGKVATERPGAAPDERVFIVVGGEEGGGGRGRGGGSSRSRGNGGEDDDYGGGGNNGGSNDDSSSAQTSTSTSSSSSSSISSSIRSNNSTSPPSPPPPPPLVVPFVGTVWPGRVHYPDFLSLAARDLWGHWIEGLRALVPFDGLWIDMCEPSNFDSNEGGGGERAGEGERDGNNVPIYPINNGGRRDPLSAKTVNIWAVGASGKRSASSSYSSSSSSAFHIDTHNLYGHAEASATRQALVKVLAEERAKKREEEERAGAAATSLLPSSSSSSSPSSSLSPPSPPPLPTPRPFILARSSFLGLGSFAAHWTGDNAATWQDLGWSVSGIMNSGLFAGASLSGADVCGFSLDTTEALCSRWVAAAAFQPFWRSHSDKAAAPQEPYLWQSVADAARRALGARYRLLPLMYSGLAVAAETGQPLMRPLWYEWPGEEGAHESEDVSWVLAGGGGGGGGRGRVGGGSGSRGSTSSASSSTSASASASAAPLFVAPPLRESDGDSVTTWLPPGKWFDLWGLMEDALGLELEVFPPPDEERGGGDDDDDRKRREKTPSSSSSSRGIMIASFDGGEHGVAGFSLPSPAGRAVALLQRQGSIVPLAWSSSSSSSSSSAEIKTETENLLLSVAAALRAPLALSVALECSNSTTPCSALGTLFVDDGETDARGDWWQLRASVGDRGGRVEAELLLLSSEESSGVAAAAAASSSSSPSSGASPLVLPRHPSPRLRKVSISFGAGGDLFSGSGGIGAITSDLGGEVEVVAAAPRFSSSSSSSSSASSIITFEFPETPSFFDDAGGRRSTRGGALSSSPVTLVSWGDGGRGGRGGGSDVGGVAEA